MKIRFIAIVTAVLMLFSAITASAVRFDIDETNPIVFGDIRKEDILAAVYESDIASLREALDLGLVTSRELTQFYLDRIERYDQSCEANCFITLCDNALEEADKRDELIKSGEGGGLLLGIPVVVKDNLHYVGYPTTNGYKKNGTVSTTNADTVQLLLDSGAVIIAKANMSTAADEWRITLSRAIGETKNAYSSEMASGGSSGGTAVSVSLNFAAAGLGSDTNSSLRLPAALNGCVSLRPSYGLVSSKGCVPLVRSRDVVGAITRTVEDQAIMLDVITGGQHDFLGNLDASALQGKRIGIIKELAYSRGSGVRSKKNTDAEIQQAFADAVAVFESCGAEVVTVSLKSVFSYAGICWKNDRAKKEEFYKVYKKFFADNKLDAVIYPTSLTAPLYTGLNEKGQMKIFYDNQPEANNLYHISPTLGVPDICVQIGHHSRNTGIGMEILGLRDDDMLVLNLAYAYTQRADHRTVPERAENLYKKTLTMAQIVEEYKLFLSAPETEEVTTEPPVSDTDQADGTSEISTDTDNASGDNGEQKEKSRGSTVAVILLAVIVPASVTAAVNSSNRKKAKKSAEPKDKQD